MNFNLFKKNIAESPAYIRNNSFMLSCATRSGSTYLVHLIRSHPDLFFHGEVLAGHKLNGLFGIYEKIIKENAAVRKYLTDMRENDPAYFLYKYVLDTQGYKGIGFKYKTDESLLTDHKQRTKLIIKDKDIKIIFLIRQNLLAQYTSHQVVLKQTGQTLVVSDKDLPEIQRLTINPHKCLSYVHDVINRQKKVEHMFKTHRTYQVKYEDIIEGATKKNAVLTDLQNFLGVKPTELSSPTKKIIRAPLSQIIINYNEVTQELRKNNMESYF